MCVICMIVCEMLFFNNLMYFYVYFQIAFRTISLYKLEVYKISYSSVHANFVKRDIMFLLLVLINRYTKFELQIENNEDIYCSKLIEIFVNDRHMILQNIIHTYV